MISFRCDGCGRIINAGDDKAGMAAVCRWCGAGVVVPDASEFTEDLAAFKDGPDIERGLEAAGGPVESGQATVDRGYCSEGFEGAAAGGPITDDAMTGLTPEQAQVYMPDRPFGVEPVEERTERGERLLFWPADAMLYPISKGGAIVLGVIVGVPVAGQWIMRLIGMWQCFLIIPYLLVLLLIMFYWFWYSAYCIRDSAAGAVRAPDIVGAAPDFVEIIWQWLQMILAVGAAFLPLFIYLSARARAVGEGAVEVEEVGLGAAFWALVALGVFLSPMMLLSVVMSESLTEGLHPVRLAMAVLRVLPVYCALVCVYVMIVYAVIWVAWNWGMPLPAASIIYAGAVYLSLVSCHVLGWFYHRYREVLDWE